MVFQPGDRIGGRYEILRLLGAGGSAVVYAVRDLALGDEIALKVLRADRMAEVVRKRCRREAAIARATASPSLVRVFDLEEIDGLVCLPMELVRGGSLRDRLRQGPLSIDEALEKAVEILEALGALHSRDVVHRDIKPGNLLLTEDGHVKLSDFGLARSMDEQRSVVTTTGSVLGTLDYLSPEQALGESVDARSDLYSFGVVLYEMLTGRPPFSKVSLIGSVVARLNERPRDIRREHPEIPRWLAAIVNRLLERHPAHRYGSVEDVLRAIRSRRGRRSLRKLSIPAALLLVLIATGIWIATRTGLQGRNGGDLPRIVSDGDAGVKAYDAGGQLLWSRPDIDVRLRMALLRHTPSGNPEIAAIITGLPFDDPAVTSVLSFLDPRTGRVLRSVRLPQSGTTFSRFANRFGVPQVLAVDLDDDGFDEVLVTYTHNPYWPSYTVLYDLRRNESRIVFMASGHHLVDSVVDVDGDGHKDLVFVGINNQMGWYLGVAAVSVPFGRARLADYAASTPDAVYSRSPIRTLLWYKLAPAGSLPNSNRVMIDTAAKRLRLRYLTRGPYEVSFDGFDTPSGTAPAARNAMRDDAYAHAREALRLANSAYGAEALRECDAARTLIRRAGDSLLGQWIERIAVRALVATGRFDEAEALASTLTAGSDAPSDTAYDAARAFHLAGELTRAIRWYRVGLGRGGGPLVGRLKYEFVEGIVLALGEQHRWTEALEEINRFEASNPQDGSAACYRRYIRWRTNEPQEILEEEPSGIDLAQYWGVEIRLAAGQPPQQVVARIDALLKRSSAACEGLLLSAKSEAMAKLGNRNQALRLAREAYRNVRANRSTYTEARAHFDLVAARYARLARHSGVPAADVE